MADEFDTDVDAPRPGQRPTTMRRVLLPTIVTLAVLIFGIAVFTGVWTDRLWFQAIGYSDVFRTVLITRVALFCILGLVFAAVVAVNIVIAYRTQPIVVPQPRRNDPVARYREIITPLRGRLLLALSILLFLAAGSVGAGQWEKYLLWRNGVAFGQGDEYFNRDIGFFIFDYPWWRFLLSYGFVLLGLTIVATAVIHYLYGGIVLQGRSNRFSAAAQVHLSILLGLFMALKAVAYWMDRFGLAISGGSLFTGISYTDAHAVIPAKNILIVIALICAVLFFANAIRRSWLLPGIGLGLLVLSSILIGGLWPAIMQSFQVKPSEPDKEAPYIENNIVATRDAFGLTSAEVGPYSANTDLSRDELTAAAESTPGTRLLDPTQVSPAFEQLQQVRGYYTMPATLDVDRYQINNADGGTSEQDIVIAARELNLDGLESSQRNWANDHTVYTHGYGIVAARGNEVGAEGQPVWTVKDIPPQTSDASLEVDQPRIYFGENSPNYSIVGQPEGADAVEVDIPQGTSDEEAVTSNTYEGGGGVPVGGWFNQSLYALKFGEPNILLSGRVNPDSKILYDRHPRERVEKVAPWLTVDGNPYPAVVPDENGERRIVWILDAYTTSSSYPLSELTSLEDATSTSLTDQSSNEALPNDQINYMRNSVKAVVDAYDGTVTLYEWDETDPILQTWEKIFPDVVQPKSEINDDLMQHLRYPEDMFKVQREMLAKYHVTDPGTFYEAGELWRVPEDPTVGGVAQPPYYLSIQMPGESEPHFSLTSVFVPQSRENLASFMAVNADASDSGENGYGTIEILQLPSETQVPGPSQMANQFNNDEGLSQATLQYKQAGLQVINGNLLTLPVGNGLLYVQPVYTQQTSATGTYPILQYVVASFGDQVGFGKNLADALNVALGGVAPPTTTPPEEGGGDNGTPPTGEVADLLQQADDAYNEAQQALQNGDLATYQDKVDEMQTLIQQAQAMISEQQTETESPTPNQQE
ncbi:MAG TPA: UPF0182 family protein [Nocardioidaceae bacterium]|nr:UPF0182 family protein [Nocardioidaceae bacterium]